MKVTEQFLSAKKDKGLRSLVVFQRNENDVMRVYARLCIEQRHKYTRQMIEDVWVETDTELRIENYSRFVEGETSHKPVKTVSFRISVNDSVKTFLKKIKSDSDVSFKLMAFNNTGNHIEVKFDAHEIYGYINDDCYFLGYYCGPDNSASPVNKATDIYTR